jgi:phosphatidylglycerophosphate synthase
MTVPLQPVQRINRSLLARGEHRLLAWLCPRLPTWVTPDVLTAFAMLAAFVTAAGYVLSAWHPAWLSISVFGFAAHWFGDSLDGTIARFRQCERPRFGYFIDHSCDGLATLVIIGGIGLSPYVRIDIALLTVAGYLLMALHTFLLAKVASEFPLSQMGAGPTELRLILIVVTAFMWILGPNAGRVGNLNAFDCVFGVAAAILISTFIVQTLRVGRRLAAADRTGQPIR